MRNENEFGSEDLEMGIYIYINVFIERVELEMMHVCVCVLKLTGG